MLSRNQIPQKFSALLSNSVALQQEVEATTTLPDNLAKWLGRLKLLYGVPINYLVPDEGMLPPESIRFFYLDFNWIDALLDGAYSIGRNLTITEESPSVAIDRATTPMMKIGTIDASAAIRSKALGLTAPVVSFKTVSGFLLRSSVVNAYPGLGVNPYPVGGTPDDGNDKVSLLNILRMERLGANSDTLICLVEGDIFRVDIHEAPEALHYGIDSFEIDGNTISSTKTFYQFSKDGPPGDSRVTMDTKKPLKLDLTKSPSGNCFRVANDMRTLKMETVSNVIAQIQSPKLDSIDASEMGFEMIEGVGMVSFYKK